MTGAGWEAFRYRRETTCGDAWPDSEFFVVRPDGHPWHPQTVGDRFDSLVTASGLPPVRPHDLRHCAARCQQRATRTPFHQPPTAAC